MSSQLSKTALEKFKKKLMRDEAMLIKRIDELQKDDPFSHPDYANDNAAIDTDVREQVGHDTIEAQIVILQKKLEKVRHAFKRIIKGTYGQCESCTQLIMLARLEVIPEARYCIQCEKRLVK